MIQCVCVCVCAGNRCKNSCKDWNTFVGVPHYFVVMMKCFEYSVCNQLELLPTSSVCFTGIL